MKKISQSTINQIKELKTQGLTNQQIKNRVGVALNTVAHYLKESPFTVAVTKAAKFHLKADKTWTAEITIPAKVGRPPKEFHFTVEQLRAHNERIKEEAYHKAAVCTVNKLAVINKLPIQKAIAELSAYSHYLVREYNLKVKEV